MASRLLAGGAGIEQLIGQSSRLHLLGGCNTDLLLVVPDGSHIPHREAGLTQRRRQVGH